MELSTAISGLNLLRQVVADGQPSWRSERKGLEARFLDATAEALAQHHQAVVSWAGEAHGFPTSTSTTAPTIELFFSAIPRRLGQAQQELDELDLLVRDRHTAVLGDPGAGKTTTLRRLATYVALDEEQSLDDRFRFVVLVVCREEDWTANDLLEILSAKLGISAKLAMELDDRDTRLRAILDSGALIIVDGLDEVDIGARGAVETALVSLARHLRNARIIISCRSGDYRTLEQFDWAEILPLSRSQIQDASLALLGETEGPAFLDNLERSSDNPSLELANRPLFLGYMAMIFRARGTVPDRPVELYDAITRLVIQDWDEHRNIKRPSRYAGFTIDDKRRFLSDLALQLLVLQRAQFSEANLVDAYSAIHERYDLPAAQATRVVQELESHTGLIQQVGQLFEFSHLSIQEYLAADSFVRGGTRMRDNWVTVPAVAAVSVALASNANDWFIDIVDTLPQDVEDIRPIHTFLSRLALERPRFIEAKEIGDRMLHLLWRGRVDEWRSTGTFEGTAMARSVQRSIDGFDQQTWSGDEIRLMKYNEIRRTHNAISVNVGVLRAIIGAQLTHEMQRRLA